MTGYDLDMPQVKTNVDHFTINPGDNVLAHIEAYTIRKPTITIIMVIYIYIYTIFLKLKKKVDK